MNLPDTIARLDYDESELYIFAETEAEQTMRAGACNKEPETCNWIATMNAGEVFFDIGANVGSYSLIAASKGLKTYAFEPAPFNFVRLKENAEMNTLPIEAIQVAIGEREGTCSFDWSSTSAGSASHVMHPDRFLTGGEIPMAPLDLFASLEPDHVKVDVDGAELKVVRGGVKVWQQVRSAQIEIDESVPGWQEIHEILEEAGLELSTRYARSVPGVWNVLFQRSCQGSVGRFSR